MKHAYKNYVVASAFILSILALCAIVCLGTAKWIIDKHDSQESFDHHWVHKELDLGEGEIPELEELEKTYSAEKTRLMGDMEVLKAELSKQLLTKSQSDQEVTESVMKIHKIHGKIQELGIKHYFDMLSILPEPKQRRLRELAADSLSAPPR